MSNHNGLSGLRGGQKAMWLRLHHQEVLDYYQTNGVEATKREFHIFKDTTMDALLNDMGYSYQPYRGKPLDKPGELELRVQICLADNSELRQEIGELRQQFADFQQEVSEQLIDKFFKPLLQAGIQLDDSFKLKSRKDRLSLEGLSSQSYKRTTSKSGAF